MPWAEGWDIDQIITGVSDGQVTSANAWTGQHYCCDNLFFLVTIVAHSAVGTALAAAEAAISFCCDTLSFLPTFVAHSAVGTALSAAAAAIQLLLRQLVFLIHFCCTFRGVNCPRRGGSRDLTFGFSTNTVEGTAHFDWHGGLSALEKIEKPQQ